MFRTRPRPLTVVVAVLLLAVTVVLTVLTWQANARSQQRLLARQLAQVGSLLSNQAAVLQTEMSDIGQVAMNTNANPDAFAGFAAAELKQTGQSLSLWRLTDGRAQRVAVQGVAPRMPAGGPDAFSRLEPDGQLVMLGVLPGKSERLAEALMPAGGNKDLLVYAETPLPPRNRIPETPNSPVDGLDVALYLGPTTDRAHLMESTVPTPISGPTQKLAVPFGSTSVTLVGRSPNPLTGTLSSALPWVVLGVGLALAVAGAATLESVTRRRADAERLAAENERLYREQRGIAGTLQHALLPAVPTFPGVEVAARYLAGVDALDIGGDWYDVIERPSGCCVFVVGDVSGHGLTAATTMAALRFAVRGFISEGHDIETVLTLLRGLLDVNVDHQFATVLLGEFDASAGRLRVVSAGHFPPLLVAGDTAETIDCPVAPPVGVGVAGPPPKAAEVQVPPSGTLIAFSDGLVERRHEVIDAGLARLRASAASAGSRPLEPMLDEVLAELDVDGGRKDDTVILGVRWAE